jgi:hypothetical protein
MGDYPMSLNTTNTSTAKTQWPEPTVPEPSFEEIESWIFDEETPEATDGCWIEPDGVCPHGHPSWLLRLGLI